MLKLYLDTSVYGGYFDEEFEQATQTFFEKIMNKEFEILHSNLLERELIFAPQRIKDVYASVPNSMPIIYDIKSVDLAKKYIEEGVVGNTSLRDCIHIAIATIYEADFLISWNFKHMVNIDKIAGYNKVNQKEGYKILEIRSPREFQYYDKRK